MSRIDDELEQAVRDADASNPGGSAGSAQASATDEARPVVADALRRAATVDAEQAPGKMRWGLLGALLALMGGVLAIVFAGGQEAVAYSYRVDEIKAHGAEFGDRLVRVQGALVAGSLVRRDSPCEYRFSMRTLHEKTGEALDVRYPLCIVPDTFRDKEGVEVTAEGRLAADGHLQASKIFAKCPSKYDPSTHEMGDSKASNERTQPEGTGSAVASSGQSASREAEFAPTRAEASAGIR